MRVDHDAPLEPGERDSLFNLLVKDMATGTVERFLNVSAEPTTARFVTQVLERGVEPRAHRAGDPAARRPTRTPRLPPAPTRSTQPPRPPAFGTDGDDGKPLDDDSISQPRSRRRSAGCGCSSTPTSSTCCASRR